MNKVDKNRPVSSIKHDDKRAAIPDSAHQAVNDDVYDVDYPEDDEKLYEGALITVKANKYERNQKARRECVAKKGYVS